MRRDWIHMRRDLGEPIPPPEWPRGLVCTALDDARAPALHALLERPPTSPQRWWRGVLGDVDYDPELCLAVVTEDARLVAGAVCWSRGFLKDIATAPEFRRRGVARALLADVLSRLQARGRAFAELKVARENAHGAVALYEGLGFERVEPTRRR